MAAIVQISNGQQWNASQVNQYVDTLSNVLGITDTAQDALGRLVLPRATSHPAIPVNGQINYRTDLGVAGRPHIYGGEQWVPYLPIRQVAEVSGGYQSVLVNAYTDLTGYSLSITTSGGSLLIFLSNDIGTSGVYVFGSGVGSAGIIRAVVGATNMGSIEFGKSNIVNKSMRLSPAGFGWNVKPAAGTYTIKLQATNNGTCSEVAVGALLTVMEFAD